MGETQQIRLRTAGSPVDLYGHVADLDGKLVEVPAEAEVHEETRGWFRYRFRPDGEVRVGPRVYLLVDRLPL